MKRRCESPEDPAQLRQKLIGLGSQSHRKSYYPQLQSRMEELERFRALLDNSKDAILLIAVSDLRVVDANDTAGSMLDRPCTDLIDLHLHDLVQFDAALSLVDLLAKDSATESQVAEGVCNFRGKDGMALPIEFTARMVVFAEKGYIVFVGRDIRDRLLAEEAMRANETRLNAILEASADPMVVYDDQGLATFVNPSFTRVFGWQPQEVIGRRIPFVPEDQASMVHDGIARLFSTGGTVTLETKRLTKDGRLLNIALRAAGIPGESGKITGMVVNLTDVSQTKNLEAQLRQSQKMEALGTLAGGIAHDFNNILCAIMGYAELAQFHSSQGQPDGEQLDQVLKGVERAQSLVKQILTFGRKGDADLRPMSLNKYVHETMKLVESSLPKMISIELHLQPALQLVNADPNQMEQVILNLATNASDAMPEGGRLTIETNNIALDDEYCQHRLGVQPGRYVILTVSDTGEGIAPDIIEHIYEPFFTTKEVGKGTGLGLAMVYGIVKGHGGIMNCYSEPGLGTTFRIYLPVHQADDSSYTEAQTTISNQILSGSETILLVDDEPSIRELGANTLENVGYRVLTAASGEEAYDTYVAQVGNIDLVVMDLGMPGMGGHKCLKSILSFNAEAKVVIASGYSVNGQVRTSLKAGAVRFLAKPYKRADLLATVRSVLDKN